MSVTTSLRGMSTAPCRSYQWRAAEIILAVLVQVCSHIQAIAGGLNQPVAAALSWYNPEGPQNYMCWKVAPRQLVNCIEKVSHAEKSAFQRGLKKPVVLFSRLAGATASPRSTCPPQTHKQYLTWRDQKSAHPSAPGGGFVFTHYCCALLMEEKSGIICLWLSTCLDSS